jgi:hypothetical protein
MISDSGSTQGVVYKRRRFVWLMAAFYTLLTIGAGALTCFAIYKIASGQSGYVVMLVIFGVVTLLTGYWMQAYLRDLNADPITVEGEILRKWLRGRLFEFLFPACYISVAGKIFVIGSLQYAGLLETDLVRVHCYPHSLTVEYVERYDDYYKKFVPTDGGAAA